MIELLAVAGFLLWCVLLIGAYLWIGEARARRAYDRERTTFADDHALLMTALREDTRR